MQPTPPTFPTDPSGLPEAARPALLELADGDVVDLRIGAVAKTLGDATVRMLGYNGSIPGPTLKVQQGSEVVVHVVNEGDLEATVHWHGLLPGPGAVLVSPAHPGGLHPGDGPVRQHPGRPRRA